MKKIEDQNACNLRSASGIVNGTGEENLMLAVDDQRPAVVRDAVVAGMRGPQVHKQQCITTQNKQHHLHDFPDTCSRIYYVLSSEVEKKYCLINQCKS